MCKQMLMHVVNVSSAFITLYSLNQGSLVESASGLACWALTQVLGIWIALTQVISPTPGYCFYCFKVSWLILFWMVAHQVSWVFRFVIASLLWLLHSINTEYFWRDCKLSTLRLSSKLRSFFTPLFFPDSCSNPYLIPAQRSKFKVTWAPSHIKEFAPFW